MEYIEDLIKRLNINENDSNILKNDILNRKKGRKCININCEKEASHNYKNEIKRLYCASCAKINMVNIKNKKCIICINKQPVFNYLGKLNAEYCGDCKTPEMIDVFNKKCINCNKRAIYNNINEKITKYCRECKTPEMVNKSNSKCKTYLCDVRQSNKFEGYCLRCFINEFPESKIIRDYGTREAKVTEFIKQEFSELDIIYNKQIEGGCSDHRPDIFIDCLTHSVIIEVDEHQHKRGNSYSTRCEIRRLNELFTSLADRPIVFIRFNPDSYTNKSGKIIKSCFEYTEDKGLPKANKTLQTRLKKLKEEININIKKVPNINITTIKLYYDEV